MPFPLASSEIEIIPATTKDTARVLAIGKTTFLETWENLNSAEDMALYLAEKFTSENIENELQDDHNQFFLALKEGKVVGYAKLRTSKTPDQLTDTRCIEIERMYVLAASKSMNVGNRLMSQCLDFATEHGYDVVWLGVWKDNHPAVRFYSRWGFEWFGYHTFVLGHDHQRDELMKKEITKK